MIGTSKFKYTYQYEFELINWQLTLPINVDYVRRLGCAPIFDVGAVQKVRQFNEIIASTVRSIKSRYSGQIVLIDIEGLPSHSKHLAGDGFHPSLEGQKSIGLALRQAVLRDLMSGFEKQSPLKSGMTGERPTPGL